MRNDSAMRIATSLVMISITSSVAVACGSSKRSSFDDRAAANDPTFPGSPASPPSGTGFGNEEGDDGGRAPERDPVTCEEAAKARSYVGCDYWPTVTGNAVPDIFDFAVVVSNIGEVAAEVHVTGPNGVDEPRTIAPRSLEKIFLPWVHDLKGVGLTKAGEGPTPFDASILSKKGAYHVVSSVPVVVYQFSPLEYEGKGGPAGKSWASCPTLGEKGSCFSYSNDASLLLPSTAWTGNYRVLGYRGLTMGPSFLPLDVIGSFAALTASADGTVVQITLGSQAEVLAGGEISAGKPGETIEVRLDAGDVAEIATPSGSRYDLSGSLVRATNPVQVITGSQCINVPDDQTACDHLEETVLPAEALGRQYVVTTPTRPKGGTGMHVVRMVGNRNGTTLTYAPTKPAGCPDTLDAGQLVECSGTVSADFVVTGSQEFGIATFMVGSSMYEPGNKKAQGDPSETVFASTDQFRKNYLFLTPDDYDVSYAVVVGPADAAPVVDGEPLAGYEELADGLGVWRVTLGPGKGGAHELISTRPVGLQAMGYGAFTSYQYPGGLNVKLIAPPPPSSPK